MVEIAVSFLGPHTLRDIASVLGVRAGGSLLLELIPAHVG